MQNNHLFQPMKSGRPQPKAIDISALSTPSFPAQAEKKPRQARRLSMAVENVDLEADFMLEHVEALLRKHVKDREEAEEMAKWVTFSEQDHEPDPSTSTSASLEEDTATQALMTPLADDDKAASESVVASGRQFDIDADPSIANTYEESNRVNRLKDGVSLHVHNDVVGQNLERTIAVASAPPENSNGTTKPDGDNLLPPNEKEHEHTDSAQMLSKPDSAANTPRLPALSSPSFGAQGWDSDLSDLTPLEDSGESEVDTSVRLTVSVYIVSSPTRSQTEHFPCRFGFLLDPTARWCQEVGKLAHNVTSAAVTIFCDRALVGSFAKPVGNTTVTYNEDGRNVQPRKKWKRIQLVSSSFPSHIPS